MKLKRIRSLVLVCVCLSILVASLVSFPVSAAVSTSVKVSGTPNVGSTITVKLNVTAKEAIASNEATLTYDGSILKFVSVNLSSQDYTNSNGSLHIVDADFDCVGKSANYTVTFKVLKAGDSKLNFSGSYANTDYKEISYSKSSSVSAKVVANTKLSKLSVTGGNLSPAFSATRTSYTVTVKPETESVKISATAQDSTAKVSGTGTYNVAVGSKAFTVSVTAADGTKKNYTVTVKRPQAEEEKTEDDPVDNPVKEPLAVEVGQRPYHVADDLSEAPKMYGFVSEKDSYNGVPINVLTDENKEYKLFYLTSDQTGKGAFYTYSDQRDEFSLLEYYTTGKRTFLFPDDGLTEAPTGYEISEINLGNALVKTYCPEDVHYADFCVFYAFSNGKAQYYQYDAMENTIQRCPAFATKIVVVADSKPPMKDSNTEENGFLGWWNGLSGMGKGTVIAFAVAAICLICLIVFLPIIILSKRRANRDIQSVSFDGSDADGPAVDLFYDNTVSLEVDPALQDRSDDNNL